jgi:hypothetical protein
MKGQDGRGGEKEERMDEEERTRELCGEGRRWVSGWWIRVRVKPSNSNFKGGKVIVAHT